MNRSVMVEKSDCVSSYDSGEAVSRFYKRIGTRKNSFIFVVTVEKDAEVHFVFTFKSLGDIDEPTIYTDFEGHEKTGSLRIYFEDGEADISSFTHRKSYKKDHNVAVKTMQKHAKEDEVLSTLVVKESI